MASYKIYFGGFLLQKAITDLVNSTHEIAKCNLHPPFYQKSEIRPHAPASCTPPPWNKTQENDIPASPNFLTGITPLGHLKRMALMVTVQRIQHHAKTLRR